MCYRKKTADLYMDNPKIRQYLYDEDLEEYLNNDLDIQKGDTVILMTYKKVKDNCSKNCDINTKESVLYPNIVNDFIDDSMLEFNTLLKGENLQDLFKMMVTAELTEKEINNNLSSQVMIHILVNIKDFNLQTLKKLLPNTQSDWFTNVEFDSIFLKDPHYPKPYRNRWYIESIPYIDSAVKALTINYQKGHNYGVSYRYYSRDEGGQSKPNWLPNCPVWKINGVSDKGSTIQYYKEFDITTLRKHLDKKPYHYDIAPFMKSKYILYDNSIENEIGSLDDLFD